MIVFPLMLHKKITRILGPFSKTNSWASENKRVTLIARDFFLMVLVNRTLHELTVAALHFFAVLSSLPLYWADCNFYEKSS